MFGFSSNFLHHRRKLWTVIKVIAALDIFPVTPAFRIHHIFLFFAGLVYSQLNRNMKGKKTQKQIWDLESSCMHNLCKSTTVSTIAASGRTRVTSVRWIFFSSYHQQQFLLIIAVCGLFSFLRFLWSYVLLWYSRKVDLAKFSLFLSQTPICYCKITPVWFSSVIYLLVLCPWHL